MISKSVLQMSGSNIGNQEKYQIFLQNFKIPLAFFRKMWYNKACEKNGEYRRFAPVGFRYEFLRFGDIPI